MTYNTVLARVAVTPSRRDSIERAIEALIRETRGWLNGANQDEIDSGGGDRADVMDDMAGIALEIDRQALGLEASELADDIRQMKGDV